MRRAVYGRGLPENRGRPHPLNHLEGIFSDPSRFRSLTGVIGYIVSGRVPLTLEIKLGVECTIDRPP